MARHRPGDKDKRDGMAPGASTTGSRC